MKISSFHSWDVSPQEAVQLQKQIREKIIPYGKVKSVRLVAGADVAYDKKSNTTYAGVVVLRLTDLAIVETSMASCPTSFPYIPGLLSFREGPAILEALDKLKVRPDLLIFDGQGIAHPRRFGIASHIGLLTAIPSIGCAKKILVGGFDRLASKRGSFTFLMDKGEVIGAAVRTRNNVSPVFVSIGHRVNLQDSIRYVLSCCRGFRLPETTRRADRLSAFTD